MTRMAYALLTAICALVGALWAQYPQVAFNIVWYGMWVYGPVVGFYMVALLMHHVRSMDTHRTRIHRITPRINNKEGK